MVSLCFAPCYAKYLRFTNGPDVTAVLKIVLSTSLPNVSHIATHALRDQIS